MRNICKTTEMAKILEIPVHQLQNLIRTGTVPCYYNDTGRTYFTEELRDAIVSWHETGLADEMYSIAKRDNLNPVKFTISSYEKDKEVVKRLRKVSKKIRKLNLENSFRCDGCKKLNDGYRIVRNGKTFCAIYCFSNTVS